MLCDAVLCVQGGEYNYHSITVQAQLHVLYHEKHKLCMEYISQHIAVVEAVHNFT